MTGIAARPSGRVSDDLLGYKPFIDGLRAVSIIAVVGYHVGLPGFGGGYVGVDVFFVISGFLIINQIAAGIRVGRFSFAEFYARRALRILPPLFTVLLACMALGSLVLATPAEYQDFGRSALASALMFANHYFWQQQGYFDVRADLKPLLHLWTLSVEEQFYLVTPFLLLGIARLARRRKRSVDTAWLRSTCILSLLSLTGCILFTLKSRNPAFFLMPLRGWEFMAGGAIGLALPASKRLARNGNMLAIPGLAAILIAVGTYGMLPRYPSGWALLPVAGAVAIILAGLLKPDNIVARGLATRPLVGIGLVSYSWYLWHWPLLAFTRLWQFDERRLDSAIVVALISLLLAIATYVAIERPARAWRRRLGDRGRWQVVFGGVLCCGFCAGLGLGISDVVAPRVAAALPASLAPSPLGDESGGGDVCIVGGNSMLEPSCLASSAGKSFGLLLGDSHAQAIDRIVRARAADRGARMISLWSLGCPPLLPIVTPEIGLVADSCIARVDTGLRSIEESLGGRLSFAIVEASWVPYLTVIRPGSPERILIGALRQTSQAAQSEDDYALFGKLLIRTMERLVAMHVQRILLIGPVPTAPRSVPSCLIRADRNQLDRDAMCANTTAEIDAQRNRTVAMLQEVARRFPNVRYTDPIGGFCDATVCRPYDGDTALLADNNHLSIPGAERLYAALSADFEWAFAETNRTSGATSCASNCSEVP